MITANDVNVAEQNLIKPSFPKRGGKGHDFLL